MGFGVAVWFGVAVGFGVTMGWGLGWQCGWGGSGALCRAGEACWWTLHPASKQRSEGEKVRVGDDIILVSVSSERYLVSVRGRECAREGGSVRRGGCVCNERAMGQLWAL